MTRPWNVLALMIIALAVAVVGGGCKGRRTSDDSKGGKAGASGPKAYRRKAMTTEARLNLKKIALGAKLYFEAGGRVTRTGQMAPQQFPSAGPTPQKVPCGKMPVSLPADATASQGWRAVGFSVDQPVRYQYQVISQGTGGNASFAARAVGDLDCDGVRSTYEITGRPDAQLRVQLSGLKVQKGLE